MYLPAELRQNKAWEVETMLCNAPMFGQCGYNLAMFKNERIEIPHVKHFLMLSVTLQVFYLDTHYYSKTV